MTANIPMAFGVFRDLPDTPLPELEATVGSIMRDYRVGTGHVAAAPAAKALFGVSLGLIHEVFLSKTEGDATAEGETLRMADIARVPYVAERWEDIERIFCLDLRQQVFDVLKGDGDAAEELLAELLAERWESHQAKVRETADMGLFSRMYGGWLRSLADAWTDEADAAFNRAIAQARAKEPAKATLTLRGVRQTIERIDALSRTLKGTGMVFLSPGYVSQPSLDLFQKAVYRYRESGNDDSLWVLEDFVREVRDTLADVPLPEDDAETADGSPAAEDSED